MGRNKELPLRIEETYWQLLKDAIDAAGTQETVAELAGVDQTTISKLLNGSSRPSYTTLQKLANALPGLPPPFIAVRDAAHARWCALGSQLAAHRPDEFRSLLHLTESAAAGVRHGPTAEQVDHLKSVIASPMPRKLARGRSGKRPT
jgi:transcriptional regulator with XRE-family HTH domain